MRLCARIVLLVCLAPFAQAQVAGPPVAPASPSDLYRNGRFADAASAARALLQQDPAFQSGYVTLVLSLLKLDNVTDALESSERALAALPQSAPLHAIRGEALFRAGFLRAAEIEYRQALKLNDKCSRGWLGLGRIEAAASHRDHAADAFSRAHALDPDDGDALYRWAVMQPWPGNVEQLELHLASYRNGPERERRERDTIGFVKALAGRKIWIPAGPLAGAEIKLENIATPGSVRGLGVRVSLNGGPRHTLLVDTGSSWITISRKLAEKSGAHKLSDFGVEGTGDAGPNAGYYAWVDKISIGGLEFHNCVIQVMMKDSSLPEEGTVGLQMFTAYQIVLDLKAHRLHLTSLPPETREAKDAPGKPLIAGNSTGGQLRQFLSFGHVMLIETRVNGKLDGLFVLDTGANATSISVGLARQAARRLKSSDQRITGNSGDVSGVYVAEDVSLDFGLRPEPGEDLQSYDMPALSSNLETEISGMIGFQSLARKKITINYRDGLLEFE